MQCCSDVVQWLHKAEFNEDFIAFCFMFHRKDISSFEISNQIVCNEAKGMSQVINRAEPAVTCNISFPFAFTCCHNCPMCNINRINPFHNQLIFTLTHSHYPYRTMIDWYSISFWILGACSVPGITTIDWILCKLKLTGLRLPRDYIYFKIKNIN